VKSRLKSTIVVIGLCIFTGAAAQTSSRPAQNQVIPQITAPLNQPAQAESSDKIFGFHIFDQEIMAPERLQSITFSEGYRLGAGDQLGIYLGGEADQQFTIYVSVDGQVYVPTVGVFQVNGKTMGQFRKELERRIKKFYSRYDLHLLLLSPKKIQVSVSGEVNSPGNYSMSAFASVIDALLMARGPTSLGSLRNLQIHRDDSLVYQVDLYEFLINSDQKHMFVWLHAGDRIYVPVRRAQVEVEGQVFRPAVYELCMRKNESLRDVLELAGGMTKLAFTKKIQLSRLDADGIRNIYYCDIAQADSGVFAHIFHNDRINVYSITDQVAEQSVFIDGEVRRPGEYPYEKNMRVSDLILMAGNLKRSAYKLEAEVAKIDPKSSVQIRKIDLKAVLNNDQSEENLLLEADDRVFIRRIPEWLVGPIVAIEGEVMFPGVYPIVKDSTTLKQILLQAGGFTRDALVREAKLIRRHSFALTDKEYQRLQNMRREEMSDTEYEYFVMKQNSRELNQVVVDFHRLMQEEPSDQNVILVNGDSIVVPQKTDMVLVTGRVSNPGGVLYRAGASLEHYIDRAGGYSWDAASRRTKIIKATGAIKDDEEVGNLEPGDRIWVPRKKDTDFWQTFRQVVEMAAQLATVYLIIKTARE
jgi:protein involved in polysaccharide export with SLBB domain